MGNEEGTKKIRKIARFCFNFILKVVYLHIYPPAEKLH